ncbi:dihydrofolate reductase [Rothia sp. HMSC065C12]|uniref:dihydrofolate reductase n=1 Tax=Rothia sp. HMSC065C12 TaxID=1739340 RepID=UPI0008A2C0BA|nr:dihydrofolate reductase [Rothia sp. HMSC065C12]
MYRLGAIWAQTDAGIIGRDGDMPWRAPEDLVHFKKVTLGAPVIMGRRTWESFPPRFRPLPGRTNIVISRSVAEAQERDGALWVPSLDAALYAARDAVGAPVEDTPADTVTADTPAVDAWILGGGSVYAEALSRTNLPAFGRVKTVERTLFYCQEGNEITGDTRAPELQLADSAGSYEGGLPNGCWRVTSESAWENSEKGYLLDESGTKNPMYFSFQRLERI